MNVNADFENIIKVLVLGNSTVGKSNFIFRFCKNDFQESHIATVGIDCQSKIIQLHDKTSVKINVFDTAGQERFMCINRNLFTRVQGILLLYDISQLRSFEKLKDWIETIKDNCAVIPIILVGNKVDLEDHRAVSYDEGKKIADENGFMFIETSAKTNVNVDKAFMDLAEKVLQDYKRKIDDTLNLGTKTKRNNGACC